MSTREFARRVAIAAGIAVLFVTFLLVVRYVANMLLVLFAGLLLAVIVDGAGRRLHGWVGLPRKAAVFVVVFGVLALLVGAGWYSGPQLTAQFGQLGERIPEAIGQIGEYLEGEEWGRTVLERFQNADGLDLGMLLGGVTGVFTTLVGLIVNLLIILFICIYLSYEPETYRNAVLKLVPRERRERCREIFGDVGSALRLWMLGQLAAMATVGTLVGLALWIAGFPAALALGVIAGILTFVPIVGPLIAAVPGIVVGFAEMGLTGVLIAAAIYTAAEQIEAYLVTPLFQKTVVKLPPAAVLAAQVVLGVLFGLLGIFLSTPLLVVAIVLVQTLYVEDVLHEEVAVMGEG